MLDAIHRRQRAAQYVRMSTDHQLQSIPYQLDVIGAYAEAHDIELVRTYADEGRSGLTLSGRPALRELLGDILGGRADFELVLVYDVSRWGRFQDSDESAHYEFVCRQAGVRLIYVAEPFGQDRSALASITKSIKRIMASEYSRELSRKVTLSHLRLARQGRRQGAPAPYGYRRWLVNAEGRLLRPLRLGDLKPRRTYYITLQPGPARTVRIVRDIFDLATKEGLEAEAIARRLNQREIPSPQGLLWGGTTVRVIVSNPVYAGHFRYNRSSTQLSARRTRNPKDAWVEHRSLFPAIVSQAQFDHAQQICGELGPRLSNEELLEQLKGVLARHGRLSSSVIKADPQARSPSMYQWRFGSLLTAYEMIGYEPPQMLPGPALMSLQVKRLRMAVAKAAQEALTGYGLLVTRSRTRMEVEGFALELVMLTPYWRLRHGWKNRSPLRRASFYLVGRVATTRDHVLDYALVSPERMPMEVRAYKKSAADDLAADGYGPLAEVLRSLARTVAAARN